MDKRPKLNREISPVDFQEFYWLKVELSKFCKETGLKTSGSKIELSQRILEYLKTGKIPPEKFKSKARIRSQFDWQNEKLTLETIVTDNYKNTENVRAFFQEAIGEQFRFNVKFMNWMKSNSGKTLADAKAEWRRIRTQQKSNTAPKEIAPQFEYNRYLRDFVADNPSLTRSDGIKLWKIKKSLRGDNRYSKEDLNHL